MIIDHNAHREIYLIFHDDIKYPFSNLIKSGFKHVFAIERQALGWSCIDASRSDLTCTLLPASWSTDIIPQFKINNPDSIVVQLKVYPHNKSAYPRPSLMSCVSITQYLLGVYWPHVLTPYMLYNKIIKKSHNHIEVVSYDRPKQSAERITGSCYSSRTNKS